MAKRCFLILLRGISIVGTLLMIIGFITPGWIIIKEDKVNEISYGIWMYRHCINATCETESLADRLLSYKASYYSYYMKIQILATLSLVTAITGCVFTLLGLCNAKYSTIFNSQSVRLFLFSVAMIWAIIGEHAKGSYLIGQIAPEWQFRIPYALIASALGSAFLLLIGFWNFVVTQKHTRELSATNSPEEYDIQSNGNVIIVDSLQDLYRISTVLCLLLLTIVGFMLQLFGFVSPAWKVAKGDLLPTEGEKTDYSSVGLWYYLQCEVTGHCKTHSLHSFFRYDSFVRNDVINEWNYVEYQVCATLSQLAAGLAVLFVLISLFSKKRSVLVINMAEICCLVSVCLIWIVIGDVLCETIVYNAWIPGAVTYLFPYSLFLSAFGSFLIFIAFMVNHIKFLCWLYRRRNIDVLGINRQNRDYMELSTVNTQENNQIL